MVDSIRCFRRLLCIQSEYLASPHFHQVAIRAVPHRAEFYKRIAQGGSHETLDVELGKWLGGLDLIVMRIKGFLQEGGYGTV